MKKVLSFTFLFLLSASVFSQNPQIHSLELDFTRTETSSNKTDEMKGAMLYRQYPYVSVLKSTYPESFVFYQNTEGNEALEKTIQDFCNWFKSDFGLLEEGYEIQKIEKEDNLICVTLKCIYNYEETVPEIKLYRNGKGRYICFVMSSPETGFYSKTELADYMQYKNFIYPSKIKTTTYNQGEVISTVVLNLSNAKVNAFPSSVIETTQTQFAEEPEQKEYLEGTSGILAASAYNFYKAFITEQDVPGCNYSPSCSHYMLQSVKAYGPVGIIKGLDRLKRCTKSEVQRNIYIRNEDGLIVEAVK